MRMAFTPALKESLISFFIPVDRIWRVSGTHSCSGASNSHNARPLLDREASCVNCIEEHNRPHAIIDNDSKVQGM